MAAALEIVWRNPEPPAHSTPTIRCSVPDEYTLGGNTFAIVYRAVLRPEGRRDRLRS
jgi:hypothetical protein